MKAHTLWTRAALDWMETVVGYNNCYGIYMFSELLWRQSITYGSLTIQGRTHKEDIHCHPARHD